MAIHYACKSFEGYQSSSSDTDICSPIRTYGKLGCAKYGVRPHDHGIVYEKGIQPELLDNEPELGFSPICVEISLHDSIGKEARVDYSKLVTIEHKVGVIFIGLVVNDDRKIVRDAVDSCRDRRKSHGNNNND